jgi:hypothetical protein
MGIIVTLKSNQPKSELAPNKEALKDGIINIPDPNSVVITTPIPWSVLRFF